MSAADQVATNNKLLEVVGDLKTMVEALTLQVVELAFIIQKDLIDTKNDTPSKRATRSRKTATVDEKVGEEGEKADEGVEKKKRAPAKKKEAKKKEAKKKEIVEDEDVDADEVVLTDAKKKRAPAKKKEGKKRQTKAEKEAAALAASLIDAQDAVNEDS
jgi:hypothetical protein